jgi:2-polyprenyl-3-methyl-5-hydroxy-6-metoxy-1,4-benzoquinol methylase
MVKQVETFDPLRYWEQRLQAHPGIAGVGYLGLSPKFLEHQYRSRMHQVELALRHYRLADLAGRSVLDIGSGTGIWLNFWHQHRVSRAVGLDFAQPSVDSLKAQFPDDLIIQADASVMPLPLPDTMRFDIISAFDVLLHIVDSDAFRRTIANLAHHSAPSGWLIISDPIVQSQGYVPNRSYAVHNKVRSITEYRDVLEAHGFVIDSVRPATVLLNNPLEAKNQLTFLALSAWWKATVLWGRSDKFASLLGPLAVKADQIACRFCSNGHSPTAKIIFARRKSD